MYAPKYFSNILALSAKILDVCGNNIIAHLLWHKLYIPIERCVRAEIFLAEPGQAEKFSFLELNLSLIFI